MKVDQDVMAVLDRADVLGGEVKITERLDRALYTRVNKALELAGGKWDRRARAHVFPAGAREALEPIFLTGEITDAKKEFDAFYTPGPLADLVIERAQIERDMTVLEPSCGAGALALRAFLVTRHVVCMDIDDDALQRLRDGTPSRDLVIVSTDFITQTPVPEFDRVIMNPPFSKAQDAKHVLHAWHFVRPGGILVAIMSAAVTFRTLKAYQEVRDLIEAHGDLEPLPDGSFKSAGTMVNTVLVTLRKPL